MSRPDWDNYFMQIAEVVATRATCDRKHVGAVLVRDRQVLSTGYNGSVRGLPHCEDVGCEMEDGHCISVLHAEQNAIAQAARHGISVNDATCYVTASPCWMCFKLLANSGIKRIVFGEFYRDERSLEAATAIGIPMIMLDGPIPIKSKDTEVDVSKLVEMFDPKRRR